MDSRVKKIGVILFRFILFMSGSFIAVWIYSFFAPVGVLLPPATGMGPFKILALVVSGGGGSAVIYYLITGKVLFSLKN